MTDAFFVKYNVIAGGSKGKDLQSGPFGSRKAAEDHATAIARTGNAIAFHVFRQPFVVDHQSRSA